MWARLEAKFGQLRASLFFIPMLGVFLGVLLGQAMLALDSVVADIDPRLTATVESARTVLTTVAGATLAFAGIAFSVSLLLISLASSQYSPRVVHGLFRDPFNKRVMGIVVGTFTYCLVVLRAVRTSLSETGDAIVPSVSILLAVVLGIASVLSIVAFINHGAHTMDVSKILHRVTEEALAQARSAWPEPSHEAAEDTVRSASTEIPGEAFTVRFPKHGWVQHIDYRRVLEQLPAGSRARLETFAGQYAIQHTPLCRVWPPPPEDDRDALAQALQGTVTVGETRTLQQDVGYGVRQLADVTLKAMSPGINDPTTAHDAVLHLGTVLSELLRRVPPAQRLTGDDGQVLLVPDATSHAALVDLGFDEVRLVSAGQPTVLVYLLDVLHQVGTSLEGLDRPEAVKALRRQADLIAAMNEEDSVPEPDRERVRAAYRDRFEA